MRTRTLVLVIVIAVVAGAAAAYADGVMRPQAKGYPKDFLRHRMTSIDVTFHGQIAVTTVTQDFVNEWHLPTDAVYSFPLPAGARATEFLFWSNDTLYKAPLRVKEQAPNPGTGEGGVDALLTGYLGPNAIRVLMTNISPGMNQRVVLKYISLCRYDGGRILYAYPLATDAFLTSPLDELSVTFHINATDSIGGFSLSGIPGGISTQSDARHATVSAMVSKTYLTRDLEFSYTAQSTALGHELFASRTASRGGHFVMMLKTGAVPDSSATLPKTIVFLLDKSAVAAGAPFQLARDAVLDCLGRLQAKDRFNVILFNTGLTRFRPASVPATAGARDSAKTFLIGATASGMSNAQTCIESVLQSFPADSTCQVLMVFTGGSSIFTPDHIVLANPARVPIFPVAISTAPATARLEIMAYQNYGFPIILKPTDPVLAEVRWLFDQVSSPIMKETALEMGTNAFELYPRDLRAMYAGSRFFLTGKYKDPGSTALSVGGQSVDGPVAYSAMLQMPSDSTDANFVESLWAKEKMDQMERRILVSGVTDSLKQELIRISLAYGIRCMYTAYVADKSQPVSGIDETAVAVTAFGAEVTAGGVRLHWSIRNTAHVRSVRVLRAEECDGTYAPLAADPGGAMVLEDESDGARHAWYRLEVTTLSGDRILSDPVTAEGAGLPHATRLLPNYPNPFNPSTVIAFEIAAAGPVQVTLTIYDVLGREVHTIAREVRARGVYHASWDGTTSSGADAAAGMYICRLQAGAVVDTRSMILVR